LHGITLEMILISMKNTIPLTDQHLQYILIYQVELIITLKTLFYQQMKNQQYTTRLMVQIQQ